MILADSSLWIQYLRVGHPAFKALLDLKQISIHWIVIGELAAGNLPNRAGFLATLRTIRQAKVATVQECLAFIETHKLYGRGIGWNDVQLLVAARLSGNPLWTLDARLAKAAAELGVGHP